MTANLPPRSLSNTDSLPTYPDLAGKVALVTGGSRGIGAAICGALAAHGVKVAVNGRDAAAIESVVAGIHAASALQASSLLQRGAVHTDGGPDHAPVQYRRGGRSAGGSSGATSVAGPSAGATSIGVVADVTKFSEIEAMRRRIENELGAIDILVANAGGNFVAPGPLEDISEEGWRASVDGNLTATFLCIKSILPGMKARKTGSIITLSSAAARRPHPRSPIPYAAAKAGIQILTQDVAAQAGPFGIRVNCLAPETILTERNQAHIPEATKQMLVEQHPLKRLGTPEDVARAVLFLASDHSGWITGVILDVAGGAVMV